MLPFFKFILIGKAIINPRNAPITVVLVVEDTRQGEGGQLPGSQIEKVAYAKPAILPIAVSIKHILIFQDTDLFWYYEHILKFAPIALGKNNIYKCLIISRFT